VQCNNNKGRKHFSSGPSFTSETRRILPVWFCDVVMVTASSAQTSKMRNGNFLFGLVTDAVCISCFQNQDEPKHRKPNLWLKIFKHFDAREYCCIHRVSFIVYTCCCLFRVKSWGHEPARQVAKYANWNLIGVSWWLKKPEVNNHLKSLICVSSRLWVKVRGSLIRNQQRKAECAGPKTLKQRRGDVSPARRTLHTQRGRVPLVSR